MSKDCSSLLPTSTEAQGQPVVGSIWRERDNRFERHIEVVNLRPDAQPPVVGIRTIYFEWAGRVRANLPKRVSYASAATFGKRYAPLPDRMSPALAADAGVGGSQS